MADGLPYIRFMEAEHSGETPLSRAVDAGTKFTNIEEANRVLHASRMYCPEPPAYDKVTFMLWAPDGTKEFGRINLGRDIHGVSVQKFFQDLVYVTSGESISWRDAVTTRQRALIALGWCAMMTKG